MEIKLDRTVYYRHLLISRRDDFKICITTYFTAVSKDTIFYIVFPMSLMSPSFDIYSQPPCIILSTTGHMNFPHMEAHLSTSNAHGNSLECRRKIFSITFGRL